MEELMGQSWWITIFVALGTGLASSFTTWLFSRKQQDIANIDAAIGTWQKIVDSLETRVNKLLEECTSLRDENSNLLKEISELKSEIMKLKVETKKITRYEKTIKDLEDKVAKYEQLLTANNIAF